jgi:hypothetical protein
MNLSEELGYFGNIWVRQNYMEKAGDTAGGHTHNHDHITLLTSGSVEVTIEGYEPKTFVAPTFIVIRKEHRHHIKALEDGTNWYCVFALRDFDGEVVDVYDDEHDPACSSQAPPGKWVNAKIERKRMYATVKGDELGIAETQTRDESPTEDPGV